MSHFIEILWCSNVIISSSNIFLEYSKPGIICPPYYGTSDQYSLNRKWYCVINIVWDMKISLKRYFYRFYPFLAIIPLKSVVLWWSSQLLFTQKIMEQSDSQQPRISYYNNSTAETILNVYTWLFRRIDVWPVSAW